jgi:hypothetical protein
MGLQIVVDIGRIKEYGTADLDVGDLLFVTKALQRSFADIEQLAGRLLVD